MVRSESETNIEEPSENSSEIEDLITNSQVIIITGKRGSGKTALGLYLLENSSKNPLIFGLHPSAWQYLPEKITPLEVLDKLPEDSTIFIDEAALWFYSRDYTKKVNKFIAKAITEARHKDQLLIFASHTLRKLDIGIVLDADAILIKEPSFLHAKLERAEIRNLIEIAEDRFQALKHSNEDTRKYVFLASHDFFKLIEVPLPSFWCEELSKSRIKVVEAETKDSEGKYSEYMERIVKWEEEHRDDPNRSIGFDWGDVRVPPGILMQMYMEGTLDLVYNGSRRKGYLLLKKSEKN